VRAMDTGSPLNNGMENCTPYSRAPQNGQNVILASLETMESCLRHLTHQYLQIQTMNANDDGPFIKKLGIKK
jgi:hypothetical protein